MPEVNIKEAEAKEAKGLSDGGHVIIRCANCNRPLADIWRTRPNQKDPRTGNLFEWKFIAQCCYCGDKSYLTTVLGGIHIGGYGVNTNDGNEAYEKTTVEVTEMPGKPDVTLLKTTKFKT